MIPAVMDPGVWASLPPYQRDAVRIGFINYTPPENAQRWPETEFGWEIFLNRFANQRRVDALWTTEPVPISIEEQTAWGAYRAWRAGEMDLFDLPLPRPHRKKVNRSPKKVLTPKNKKRKSVFSAVAQHIRRAAENTLNVLRYRSACVLPPHRV